MIFTAMRMRALYLAVSPDFTYSQSSLSLLSTLSVMLDIVICFGPAVHILYSHKKRQREKSRDEEIRTNANLRRDRLPITEATSTQTRSELPPVKTVPAAAGAVVAPVKEIDHTEKVMLDRHEEGKPDEYLAPVLPRATSPREFV